MNKGNSLEEYKYGTLLGEGLLGSLKKTLQPQTINEGKKGYSLVKYGCG